MLVYRVEVGGMFVCARLCVNVGHPRARPDSRGEQCVEYASVYPRFPAQGNPGGI